MCRGSKGYRGGAGELEGLDVGSPCKVSVADGRSRRHLQGIDARAAADGVDGEFREIGNVEGIATAAADESEGAIVGVELDKGIIADTAEDGID